jgi:hypothetical protein
MSARRRCAACGKPFRVRPQVPDQSYCSDPACQRERKKLWQRNRRSTDPDYRDNQARAQQAWAARNPDYWRQYRARKSQYTDEEQLHQVDGRQEIPEATLLPTSSSQGALSLTSGVYRLSVLRVLSGAKMDASFIVELVPLRAGPQK